MKSGTILDEPEASSRTGHAARATFLNTRAGKGFPSNYRVVFIPDCLSSDSTLAHTRAFSLVRGQPPVCPVKTRPRAARARHDERQRCDHERDRPVHPPISIARGVLGKARSPRAMESVLTVARRSSGIAGGREPDVELEAERHRQLLVEETPERAVRGVDVADELLPVRARATSCGSRGVCRATRLVSGAVRKRPPRSGVSSQTQRTPRPWRPAVSTTWLREARLRNVFVEDDGPRPVRELLVERRVELAEQPAALVPVESRVPRSTSCSASPALARRGNPHETSTTSAAASASGRQRPAGLRATERGCERVAVVRAEFSRGCGRRAPAAPRDRSGAAGSLGSGGRREARCRPARRGPRVCRGGHIQGRSRRARRRGAARASRS